MRSRISHYEQSVAGGRYLRGIGRLLLNTMLAVAVVAGGAAGGLYLWGQESLNQTAATSGDIFRSTRHLRIAVPNQPVIALVVGYDKRRGLGGGRGLSDTMMLVRLDPRKGSQSISLLSFPRDLRVPLYCSPGVSFGTGKINSAYARCGVTGTLLTVKALTGLPINYDVSVNFRGFKDIVNKMGGVWIDVDRRYYNHNVHTIATDFADIDLKPGYQLLSGGQALDYARYRHGDSDLYRIIRQQAFIRSFRQQASKLSFTDYIGIVNTITRNVQRGGSISIRTLLGYAELIRGLSGGSVIQVKLENVTDINDGTFDSQVPEADLQKAIEQFSHPDLTADTRAASQNKVAHGKSQADAAPAPEKTTVLVLNASDTAGLAGDTSSGLALRGYKVVQPAGGVAANYPSTAPLWHTIVYYDPAQAKSKAAATKLATFFGAASVEKIVPKVANLANGAMVVAALGQTFDGKLPAIVPKVEVPAAEAPKVTVNPGLTAAALSSLQHSFPFRLEVPSRVESSSSMSSELPIRVYRIAAKQTALRLTFKLSNYLTGYWSIEETAYTDAPILTDVHYTHLYGRRTFDFYYQSGRLHMVVLRENGASYWVINTLDNVLSNETMIAIAKGLRPAGGHIHK